MKTPPDKLGSFYLGADYDLDSTQLGNLVNYDARDLTTHGICVGMTGSGKTGLCLGLLEEAALDKVPAILIDPKGDITNLLLQFPEQRPDDFLPWVNPDDARRKDMTVEEYAEYIADLWRNGLARWGIGKQRIRALTESVKYTIYTPGSNSGIPVNILSSFAAPASDFNENAEILRERINGMVAAILTFSGYAADSLRSREAILLSTLFEYYWRRHEDLDLEKLIHAIQDPPVRRLGVFEVDSFYPKKDRFELALALNSLVASPSFRSWLQGEPLDVQRLFYTSTGAPRHSIFYIAHLSDRERMFFVTLLLEQLLVWVRSQAGTTSLRALLYFDEVFGFFPPVAEPPSKRPLLTLLKQARAFGLGVLLVTQNPVDIDYKGLTNAGTWFIGKLQTDRDKQRVLQGLEGAIAESGGDRKQIDYDKAVSRLTSRVFLMHNIHETQPRLFHTRWVMSYLRGPLTRPQVQKLMRAKKQEWEKQREDTSRTALRTIEVSPTVDSVTYSRTPPVLTPSMRQYFIRLERTRQDVYQQMSTQNLTSLKLVYEPTIVGAASIRFTDRKWKFDDQIEQVHLAWPGDSSTINWNDAILLTIQSDQLSSEPTTLGNDEPYYAQLPEQMTDFKTMRRIEKAYSDWLYHTSRLPIQVHSELGLSQKPREDPSAFASRVQQAAREKRDQDVDKVEKKYAKQLQRLEKKIQRLEREFKADQEEYSARKREEAIGAGESVLSFFLGRRRTRDATTIARRRRYTSKAKRDMEETLQEIDELKNDTERLELELKKATEEITEKWDNALNDISKESLKPRRSDVNVQLFALLWTPIWHIKHRDGIIQRNITVPAYTEAS